MAAISNMADGVEVENVVAMVTHLATDAGCSFHGACINIDASVTTG